jgi:hypothetical protein
VAAGGLLLAAAPVASAAIAQGPADANRDPYEMFTIGDSAAAGEGAPDVEGNYNNAGDVVDVNRDGELDFEDWDTRFGGSPATPGLNQDSTRCHRSGHLSGSAVARSLLQAEFPDVLFDWVSVACSGASIVQLGKLDGTTPAHKGGVLRDYDGVEKLGKRGISQDQLSPLNYPPQISQLNTILAARPNGPTKRIDALLMNLGVNDTGFGDIVTDCLDIRPPPLDLPDDQCHTHDDNKIPKFVARTLGTLDGRFNRLAAAINGAPLSGSGDPKLDHRPAEVFLTALPNPVRPTPMTFCDHQPPGNFEQNLSPAESEWVEANVLLPLNARFATEATQHTWRLVNDHVNAFFGHAICSPSADRWVRTNLDALRTQGELDETTGLPIAVGGSIVHPNPTGYAQIGAAIRARMRPFVVDRYTPDSAPTTTTLSSATGFTVTLGDANLPTLRSGYWHRVKLRQLNANGTISNILPLSDLGYGTSTANFLRTGRYFVTARACGPLSRDGGRGCGPISSELRVSTIVPARPVNLDGPSTAQALEIESTNPGLTLTWAHADGFALHDTRRSIVRIRRSGADLKTATTKTIQGPFTSASFTGLESLAAYQVAVKACNDGNRCSAFTPEVTVRASRQVEAASLDAGAPLFGLQFELQQIKVALRGVPCTTSPVSFDPGLGPGTPGFEDPTPAFQPSCPTDPPVGRLRFAKQRLTTRTGRPVSVELRWRHPRRWRHLKEVAIQMRGRRGTLATLRFNQDANTLALGAGTSRRGRSRSAGQAGTLSARGVQVRVAKDAVRGSGATGASVRLRFRILLPRSARPGIVLAVGASDDTGQLQAPAPAAQIRLR